MSHLRALGLQFDFAGCSTSGVYMTLNSHSIVIKLAWTYACILLDEFKGRPPRGGFNHGKVHDNLIEERLERERPCRTLFIRNIKVRSTV